MQPFILFHIFSFFVIFICFWFDLILPFQSLKNVYLLKIFSKKSCYLVIKSSTIHNSKVFYRLLLWNLSNFYIKHKESLNEYKKTAPRTASLQGMISMTRYGVACFHPWNQKFQGRKLHAQEYFRAQYPWTNPVYPTAFTFYE